MTEGIIQLDNENIADFLINNGYDPFDVVPMCCVLSGSRAYGLSIDESDRDYLGIHLMDTWDCLEHPDFRLRVQVIRQRFDDDFKQIPPGEKGGTISLDSFEMWKFISLFLKGSAASYELLYMPPVHCDPEAEELFHLMRSGITSRIGKAAKGVAIHSWTKDKNNRKKTVIAYYRLMQALLFLKEGEFEWNIGNLLEYMEGSNIINVGKVVIGQYTEKELRQSPIIEVERVGSEINCLIDEVDKAGVVTRLPDQVPKPILKAILAKVKKTRSLII